MPTPNETIIAEEKEAKKEQERWDELSKKPEIELTEEEKTEKGELKERYGKRMQDKINKLTWEAKSAKEETERLKKEKEETNSRLAELEKKAKPDDTAFRETVVEIDGKKWFTDEALLAKMKAGEITEDAAYKYQRDRDRAEAVVEVEHRFTEKRRFEEERNIRVQDAGSVIEKHPEFNKQHPNHNPDDPLYKLSNEIYNKGYASNPRGLSEAVKLAKQVLRISDTPLDRSDEFGAEDNNVPERGGKGKDVTLSSDEKDAAEKMFCRGDVINPITKRAYTPAEAHVKALQGKKARLERR